MYSYKLVFSSTLFQGFTVRVKINASSKQELIDIGTVHLKHTLIKNNFENLLREFSNLVFHIHASFKEIQECKDRECPIEVWICDSPH